MDKYLTFSCVLIIGYYPKLFQKKFKKSKKSKKKIHQIFLKLNFYYVIPMQGLQKSWNVWKIPIFALQKYTKQLICILLPRATQKGPYFYEYIFSSLPWGMSHMLPGFSRKKFILLSKFDQKSQKFITKSSFLWLKTLQFQLHCFSCIL